MPWLVLLVDKSDDGAESREEMKEEQEFGVVVMDGSGGSSDAC